MALRGLGPCDPNLAQGVLMSKLIQLGNSYAEVEDRKRLKAEIDGQKFEANFLNEALAPVRFLDERTQARKIVLQDLPARVLIDGDWMSIDMIDMSEKGFSFEVDRVMGGLFHKGQRLVFALRIPELREFTMYGRIQWTKFDEDTRMTRCGVELIEVHGPGGGISVKELIGLLLSYEIHSQKALPMLPPKKAA